MANKALLIGVSNYLDRNIDSLLAPEHDIERLDKLLRQEDVGPFEVKVLLDPDPTDARTSILHFYSAKNCRDDDLLFLYFAGHGIRSENKKLFFALTSTTLDGFEANGLEADFLFNCLENSPSKRKVVALDCCHSGIKAKNGNFLTRSIAFDPGYISEQLVPNESGTFVLTACSGNESAFEDVSDKDNPHSIFTKLFCDGIETGEAGLESEFISIRNLYKYIFDKRPKKSVLETEPQLSSSNEVGESLTFCKNPSRKLPIDERLFVAARDEKSSLRRSGAYEAFGKIMKENDRHQAEQARDFLEKRLNGEDVGARTERDVELRSRIEEILSELDVVNGLSIEEIQNLKEFLDQNEKNQISDPHAETNYIEETNDLDKGKRVESTQTRRGSNSARASDEQQTLIQNLVQLFPLFVASLALIASAISFLHFQPLKTDIKNMKTDFEAQLNAAGVFAGRLACLRNVLDEIRTEQVASSWTVSVFRFNSNCGAFFGDGTTLPMDASADDIGIRSRIDDHTNLLKVNTSENQAAIFIVRRGGLVSFGEKSFLKSRIYSDTRNPYTDSLAFSPGIEANGAEIRTKFELHVGDNKLYSWNENNINDFVPFEQLETTRKACEARGLVNPSSVLFKLVIPPGSETRDDLEYFFRIETETTRASEDPCLQSDSN